MDSIHNQSFKLIYKSNEIIEKDVIDLENYLL
jgi:hypothetical protein